MESKPHSPDYINKSIASPDMSKAATRQTARHSTRRNFRSQFRTDTAHSIDRRQFILSQGSHGRGMLESPKGPTVLAPTTIIEKMIRNRNRVSTRGYEGSGLGFGKRSLHIETVTNSDIYLDSQFAI